MGFLAPKPPSSTTTVQKTEPWKSQQPYLKDLFSLAQQAYGNVPKDIYTGPTQATYNPWQTAAFQGMGDLALGSQGMGQGTMDLANRTINGDFLSPDSNPWLKSVGDTVANDMSRQWESQILPNIRDSAVASGAYGGSGNIRSKIESAYDLSRSTGETLSKLFGDQYQQERKIQQLAPQMLAQGFGIEQSPWSLLASAGQGLQQGEQIDINNILGTQSALQQQPWLGLPEYSQLIGNVVPGGGTSTTSGTATSGGFGGALQGAIGGGAMAGALGSTIPALSFLGGPFGIAAAALLGGAGGYFG